MRDFSSRNHPAHSLAAGISRRFPRAAWLLLCVVILASRPAAACMGRVLDAASSQPIADAIVTLGDRVVRTDGKGQFDISGPGDTIGFRAYGYLRESVATAGFEAGPHDVKLQPFRPKALYLSFYGVGSRTLREAALAQIGKRGMNAVVIDVKGDRGLVSYKSSVALAQQVRFQGLPGGLARGRSLLPIHGHSFS